MTPFDDSVVKLFSGQQLNYNSVMLDILDVQNVDYSSLEGILNRIKNEEMCISKNNETKFNIWWNPEYTNELIDDINPAGRKKCR